MIAQSLAIATLFTASFAGWSSKTGSCNTGNIQCCSETKEQQESTGQNKALLSTGNILDQVSLNCDQIPVLAIAIEDECKNTPVCCEDSDDESLVGISCTVRTLLCFLSMTIEVY